MVHEYTVSFLRPFVITRTKRTRHAATRSCNAYGVRYVLWLIMGEFATSHVYSDVVARERTHAHVSKALIC